MSEPAHILVVDDELSVREMLSILLSRLGHRVNEASSGRSAVALLEGGNRYDMVITDLAMDNGDGLFVLENVLQRDKECPVIVITAFGTTDTAVDAMKKGAYDYIAKPFNIEEFKVVVNQALEHRAVVRENRRLKAKLLNFTPTTNLIGRSHAIKQITRLIDKIKSSQAAVLITGQSGTGKEVIARAIHEASAAAGNKANPPFVAVNCGALPEQLMESELFGHVKGAFTGAFEEKDGLVQNASGGTLFLDEIGELPAPLQVKLLRVLQEKRVRKVGKTEEVPVDFRVISATNRDLAEQVATGSFREDLYYRLNVIAIEVPPLCERPEDIDALIDYFTPILAAQAGRGQVTIDPAARNALLHHHYQGNVRELKNILERSITLASSSQVQLTDLPPELQTSSTAAKPAVHLPGDGILLDEILADIERQYIDAALAKTGGVQSSAAELLGITVRSLRYRLNRKE